MEYLADSDSDCLLSVKQSNAYWVIFHAFLSSADFFNQLFGKKCSECQTVWTLIGPDQGLDCLPRLSADDTDRQLKS